MAIRYVEDRDGMRRLGAIVTEAVEETTEAVASDARRYVPIDTGELHDTIEPEHLGDTGRVWVGSDHWEFVEYGTRYMDAQPYMRPALYQERDL